MFRFNRSASSPYIRMASNHATHLKPSQDLINGAMSSAKRNPGKGGDGGYCNEVFSTDVYILPDNKARNG